MIRLAEQSHFDQIDEFDVFAGDRHREIADGRLVAWVDGGRAVGYVTVADYRFHGYRYVQFLCVRKEYRRKGIASALLGYVEGHNVGARLFISTESTNMAMLSLLEGRGYCLSGALAGLNRDGSQEVFFYKDVSA